MLCLDLFFYLLGLFNMLSDSSHEIRQQADTALAEFLQEIKNAPSVDYGRMVEILVQRAASADEFTRLTSITWVNEFVKLGGEHLVPYYGDILGAILPAISDKEEKIRVVLSPPLSMPAMSEQCFRIDASRAVVTLTAIMDDCFH
jgi:vacuole morphology and inheritance protein 14